MPNVHIEQLVDIVKSLGNSKNKAKIDQALALIQNISNQVCDSSVIIDKLNNIELRTNKSESSKKQHRRNKPKVIVVKSADRVQDNNADPIIDTEGVVAPSNSLTAVKSNPAEIGGKIKDLIRSDYDITCLNLVVTNRHTRIVVDGEKDEQKVRDLLSSCDFKDDITVESLQPLQPQVSCIIYGGKDDIEEIDIIKRRNNIPADENFSIVALNDFPSRSNNNRTFVIFRMSKVARQIIENRGRIIFGLQSVPFKDNFNVRVCSRCCRIGHTAKYCSNAAQCGNCKEEHTTHECTKPIDSSPKCLLCLNSGFKSVCHKPRSTECSSYNQAVERIIQITDYEYCI